MLNPDFLQSELFRGAGFSHAFFTRRGGVSSGPFESLNFSISVGDDPLRVEQNLRRAAQALGVTREQLYFVSQVHGTGVCELGGDEPASEVTRRCADVVLSAAQGVACAVRTADCLPVLFADPRSGAVAAAHAGWRGLVRGVLAAAVRALEARQCKVSELLVAIGPHISVRGFEVSAEVAAELQAASPNAEIVRDDLGEKPHCDLRGLARSQLTALGISAERIDDVLGCTWTDPSLFFSYRRDGKTSGRHLSAIVVRT